MDAETVNQRIRAARALRGMEQADLDALFAEDGLGKQESSRLERGELPLTAARRHALVRHLRVPETWFLAESADEVVGVVGEDYSVSERVAGLDEQLRLLRAELATRDAEVLSRIDGVHRAIRDLRGRPPQ